MADTIQGPSSYLDFAGLRQLRGKAHGDSASAARETSQQFEGLFIQMMLKSMRDATPKSDFLNSSAMDTYQDLYDKEISTQFAKRGVLGIGDMLTRQLGRAQAAVMDPGSLAKPAGMVHGAGSGATGTGFPLTVKRPDLPLQPPARVLHIARPLDGGLPLKIAVPAVVGQEPLPVRAPGTTNE
jgi:Rod binding domain-containing protein